MSSVLRFAAVRSIGMHSTSLSAPASVRRLARRHVEGPFRTNAPLAAHCSSGALSFTYPRLAQWQQSVWQGLGASSSLPGSLLLSLQGGSKHAFSTSLRAGDGGKIAAIGDAAVIAPSVVLVKVGDGGKWVPFRHKEVMAMDLSELLKALKADDLFGSKFQPVDLVDCGLSVFKLPAGMDQPTAADEADTTKFVKLEAAKTVGRAAGSVRDGEQICVRIQLPTVFVARKSITYRLMGHNGLSEPTVASFESAADFGALISGRSLVHMRVATPAATPQGKKAKQKQDGVEIGIVTSLDGAVTASQVPGTYLELRDACALLCAPVSNVPTFRDTTARAFEEESNKALARDEQLLKAYGELRLLNDGRSVTFYDASSNNAFLELDGVILNATVAMINEAKSSLQKHHVTNLTDVKLEQLEQILAKPSLYRSEPADAIKKLAGLRRVPVVSGRVHSAGAKVACAKKGVHLLASDGSGYRCTLHNTPSVKAAAGATPSRARAAI